MNNEKPTTIPSLSVSPSAGSGRQGQGQGKRQIATTIPFNFANANGPPPPQQPQPQGLFPEDHLIDFTSLSLMDKADYFNGNASGNHGHGFPSPPSASARVVGTGDSLDSHSAQPHETDECDNNSDSSKLAKRCPTFTELGSQIKQLQQENFQLKLRIYLHESKHGKPIGGGAQDSVSVSATTEITREFTNLKQSNETLQRKVIELENINQKQEQIIRDAFRREDILRVETHSLTQKLEILERELALAKLKRTESDEVEKCLRAFSMSNCNATTANIDEDKLMFRDGSYVSPSSASVNKVNNNESEERLQQIHNLLDEVSGLTQQIEEFKRELQVKHSKMIEFETIAQEKTEMLAQLDAENEKLKEKQSALIKALKEIGCLNVQKDQLCEQLKAENEELRQIHERTCNSLKELKKVGMEANLLNQELIRQDSSPDLGIESGQDVHLSENYVLKTSNHGKLPAKPEEIEILRLMNKQLASKLKHTRQALAKTLEKLDSATRNREEIDKTICRHLHKTHAILRHARKNLEVPGEPVQDPGM